MVLNKVPGSLVKTSLPEPKPGRGQVLLKVKTCGVCRTDLHVIDGELKDPHLPLIPGHEIVGEVVATGPEAERFPLGTRVGVPWLGYTCGTCEYCQSGRENLCDQAKFTGYQINGGYSEYTIADEHFCFYLPDTYSDLEAAPLLCAGLIGYRSYRMAGEAKRLGIYGFGAAAHIIAQVAIHEGRKVFAFTRPGDKSAQGFAKQMGAVWAGDSSQDSPKPLDAAILFAPVGSLVPQALKSIRKGGTVVCAGIHMSDIPAFSYQLLWGERRLCSVANLTRQDGEAFLKLAPKIPIKTEIQPYLLNQANEALWDLKQGKLRGAAVLQIG